MTTTGPNSLTPAALTPLLPPTLGHPYYYLPQVNSTNSYAFDEALRGAPHGTLVVAEEQTGGRGRLGRAWHSPAGRNIYASLILRPPLSPTRAAGITLTAAVGLAEGIERNCGLAPHIKWPNDLRTHDRKLAGILTEMSGREGTVDFVVLGFGLNVNLAEAEIPEDLRPIATSLRMALGHPVDRAPLLAAILTALEQRYTTLIDQGLPAIMPAWKARCDTFGKMVVARQPQGEVRGRMVDLTPEGALVLETATGRQIVYAGDIIPLAHG